MTNREEYIRQLEHTIGKLLAPLRDIPYPIAIKVLTGCKVLAFDPKEAENRLLLAQLGKAVLLSGERAFQEGVFANRPNEAGNSIERFLRKALNDIGLAADTARTKSGKGKSAGYPDIQVIDEWGRVTYIDCKTYSTETKEQTLRTFYFSPSDDPKIARDAFHLLVSFELDRAERAGRMAFVPISWQIYTLDKLLVQVKHEFNASNKELYKPEALLASGAIPSNF